jgi:hypothetical protein
LWNIVKRKLQKGFPTIISLRAPLFEYLGCDFAEVENRDKVKFSNRYFKVYCVVLSLVIWLYVEGNNDTYMS